MAVASAFFFYIVLSITLTKVYSQQNERQGQRIVDAIEAFKISNEKYPQHIDDIVPQYIDELPSMHCLPLAKSSNYEYWPKETDGFMDAYRLYGRCGYVKTEYDLDDKTWIVRHDN